MNEKYVIKVVVDEIEKQIGWKLQDLYVDCLKDNKDKEYIIKAILEELLNHRVGNILSMLKK